MLRAIGHVVLLVGVATTLTGIGFVRNANEEPSPPQPTIPTFDPSGRPESHPPSVADTTRAPEWFAIPLGVALIPAGVLLVVVGRKILFRGKRETSKIITIDELIGHRFVLYLRPFLEDRMMASIPRTRDDPPLQSGILPLGARAYEEILVKLFRRQGKMVAVGEPGERLPLPGARRFYLPIDDWQDTVSDLMSRATLIVLVATPGPGTIWELTEAVRIVAPTRLVLVVCHGPELYEHFREAATAAFAKRQRTEDWSPPKLPPYPPGDERNPNEMMIKGFVSFDSEWRPEFRWFEERRRERFVLREL